MKAGQRFKSLGHFPAVLLETTADIFNETSGQFGDVLVATELDISDVTSGQFVAVFEVIEMFS